MATSGDITYVVNRDDIIQEAMEQIGVLGEGDAPNADQLTAAATTLNNMVKAWQARGIQIFSYQKLFLVPQKDQHIFELYSGTSDFFTTELGLTQTTAALVATDTVVDVVSTTGMAMSDVVIVLLDSGFWYEDVIASVDTSTQLTLTTGIPAGGTVASGRQVYWMDPVKANRPMKVNLCYRRTYGSDGTDGTDTPVEMISRSDYFDQSIKSSDGQMNQAFYDPQVGNPFQPEFYIWPEVSDASEYLVFWGQRSIDTFLTATDDADFPQEWYEALSFGLAVRLCPKFGASDQTFRKVSMLSEGALFDAESGDTEADIEFQPDYRWNR